MTVLLSHTIVIIMYSSQALRIERNGELQLTIENSIKTDDE